MKIDLGLDITTLTQNEHFFMATWYNLSHEDSLDSDRVSVFGIEIAIRELLHLYDWSEDHGAKDKRNIVGYELYDLLQAEPLLDLPHYSNLKTDLSVLLKRKQVAKHEYHAGEVNRQSNLLASLIRQLKTLMDHHYLDDAFANVQSVLDNPSGTSDTEITTQQEKILAASDRLAGALIVRGAALQDLSAYYRSILNRTEIDPTFQGRFSYFKQRATCPNEDYEVAFKIRSESLVNTIGNGNSIPFSGFKIEVSQPLPNGKVPCTAKAVIKAPNYTVAGSQAFDHLSKVVDSLGYALGRSPIIIEKKYTATRLSPPHPTKTFRIHKLVPNPNYSFDTEKFNRFVTSMNQGASHANGFADAKVASVFRLIRIAQDTENIEARLTTYWTALESVTRDAVIAQVSAADDKVAAALVPCILIDYLSKRLKAYIEALYHLNIRHIPVGGVSTPIKEVPKSQLIKLLRDDTFINWLMPQLNGRPYFTFKLNRFLKAIQDPGLLNEALASHKCKVERQIKRIYRGRNCIVHDAERVFAVEFLCANLEHYLQAAILGMIDVMSNIPTVIAPEECFLRYQHWVDTVKKDLEAGQFESLDRLLKLHD